jgi:hypothetical protein
MCYPRDHWSVEMDALVGAGSNLVSQSGSLFIRAPSAGGPAGGIAFIHQSKSRGATSRFEIAVVFFISEIPNE